jgi:hypothetical protein
MNRARGDGGEGVGADLTDSVKKMSVQDAKGILTGGDDAATQYFRRTTSDTLTKRFLPSCRR